YLLCSDGLSGQVTDSEIGAVASVLPPAEACRFLVDLANLRGGPDNITVVIVRVASGAEVNGLAPVPTAPRPQFALRLPWWATCMVVGTLLAVGATFLMMWEARGVGVFGIVLAVGAFLAGLVGLFLHYQNEQDSPAGDEPPP